MRKNAERAGKRPAGAVAVLTAAAIAGWGADAVAEGPLPDYYLSFGAIYSEPDNQRLADYGTGGSIGYARRLGGKRWIEAKVFNTVLETGATTAVDFFQTGAGIDLLQDFGNQMGQHFFVLGGLGWVLNDVKPDADDGDGLYANVGLGWRVNASENWGVRPRIELRYFYDTFEYQGGSGQGDVQLALAFEIPPRTERVIEKRVEVQKIVEVPVEVEKIVEKEIECAEGMVPMPVEAPPPASPPSSPYTAPSAPSPSRAPAAPSRPAPPEPAVAAPPPYVAPAPAPVAPAPEPAPPAAAEPAGPDSDGDGVPDDKDRCPDTSQGAAVGPNGCVRLD